MTPRELAEECWTFLNNVLAEVYERSSENGDVRGPFIYRHARNITDIGRDVLFLYDNDRYTAARIAVRSMIESMFCVVACAKLESFPEEKIIAECENAIERISKLNANNTDLNLTEAANDYVQLATTLRAKYGVTTRKKWNVYEIAELADLKQDYAGDYFIHCGYVHVTVGGIVSQENTVAVGHSYRTAIGAMVFAAAFLVQVSETAAPQKHVNNASRLLGILTDMVKEGQFKDEEDQISES